MSGLLGVVGDLVEDVVVWHREPRRESTDTAAAIHRTRGGSAANVAAHAEHPVCLLICVGADATGDRLVEELRSRGVRVREQRRDSTGTVVVLVDETGERSMFPDRGASALLSDVDSSSGPWPFEPCPFGLWPFGFVPEFAPGWPTSHLRRCRDQLPKRA